MSDNICMIAHRGYSAAFQENTESAFVGAVNHGSGGAETDIRITADGVLVTNHNADVVFADGTKAVIEENTFDFLTSKPIKNNKTDDVIYLCTFRRYLEIMRDNNMVCFIELKGEFSDEQIKRVFELAAEVYDLNKVILQSFSFENLVKCRSFYADIPLMLTYGASGGSWERCFDYGFSIDSDIDAVTEEMIEQFHAHSLQVGAWTANDKESLLKMRAMGVDYIESDVFGGYDE